jgi:hypothetical protein
LRSTGTYLEREIFPLPNEISVQRLVCLPSWRLQVHRFSPLNQINEQSVGKLGLPWSRELGTTRGLEATPLVEDGVIYTSGSWSVVYAIDARTGEVRWTYDPKVPRSRAFFICCDVVNRGVALYKGEVYEGTLDGRLIALDKHRALSCGRHPSFRFPRQTLRYSRAHQTLLLRCHAKTRSLVV